MSLQGANRCKKSAKPLIVLYFLLSKRIFMHNIVLNQTEQQRKTIYVPNITSQDFNDIFKMKIN